MTAPQQETPPSPVRDVIGLVVMLAGVGSWIWGMVQVAILAGWPILALLVIGPLTVLAGIVIARYDPDRGPDQGETEAMVVSRESEPPAA